MKHSYFIVDTLANLEASDKIIPDGIIVKEAFADTYKIGNGMNTFVDLPEVAAENAYELSGFEGTLEE
jgi:hypothetical protein